MAGLARGSRTARVAALAIVATAIAALPASSDPLRVMALGDSVTVGVGSSHGAGYRSTFWTLMRDAGVEIDMVGGKQDGPDTFDKRHQGYEKTSFHELSGSVHDKVRTYQPEVVLLLAGTDEARSGDFSPHVFAANLGVMIDRIFTAKHDAKLLISTVPPTKFARKQGAKRALNELVRRTVRERAARGEAVYLVDSFAVLDPQRDMSDSHYPNDAGYERIGEAFAHELLSVLGAEKVE